MTSLTPHAEDSGLPPRLALAHTRLVDLILSDTFRFKSKQVVVQRLAQRLRCSLQLRGRVELRGLRAILWRSVTSVRRRRASRTSRLRDLLDQLFLTLGCGR